MAGSRFGRAGAAFTVCALMGAAATAPRLIPGAGAQPQAEQQLACASRALRAYVVSGAYERNVRDVLRQAHEIIGREARPDPAEDGPKPAIVMDIDDTALSTFAMLAEGDFCIEGGLYQRHAMGAKMPAVVPVLEVYKAAREKGIAVFFVSSRGQSLREATEANLRGAGYGEWGEVFLRPADWEGDSASFKTHAREEIESRAYRILINIGDQLTDLKGGHAEHEVLVPNPFYTSR